MAAAAAAAKIGMMDIGYFVGRSEILAWINATLHLKISRIEEVVELFLGFLLLLHGF